MSNEASSAGAAAHGRTSRNDVSSWVRVLVMLLAVSAAAWLSHRLTGSALPTDAQASLIFQNALLLVVLGSAIGEHKFTTPSDAVLNSLAGIVTLLGVYYAAPTRLWWLVFAYCIAVFVAGTACVAVSESASVGGWRRTVADWTYRPATKLGQARLLFSILFLFALFAFYSTKTQSVFELILFWGLYVVLWPLGVLEWVSSIRPRGRNSLQPQGIVARVDWPNLMRLRLDADVTWKPDSLWIVQQPDGIQRLITPLYAQAEDREVIGTAICIGDTKEQHRGLLPGALYKAPQSEILDAAGIAAALGADDDARMVGFVVENSEISEIRFETWDAFACSEGMIIFAVVGERRVYYQITNGCTAEESARSHRRGFQIATATQLGTYSGETGFQKFGWLPAMNAPIFQLRNDDALSGMEAGGRGFTYGVIPGTAIPVTGDVLGAIDHHTAILGATGSGKTELAFDVVRHAVEAGVKVLCFDLTGKYILRLAALSPESLALPAETSARLGELLFDAETGEYGAGKEKKVLKGYTEQLRRGVRQTVEQFLANEEKGLGVVTLEEISNTKGTLAVTELYLSTVLRIAMERGEARRRILLVLEEAHTIVPEPSSMGLGDFDSRGVVAKIAQIALQGRKYGVGLLVIAQRTATVSKSILTQCNTVISFACIDETSLGFLENVFGRTYAKLLPNLPRLRAIAAGKGVRGERPLLFEVPFDPDKASAADVADGRGDGAHLFPSSGAQAGDPRALADTQAAS